LLTLLLKLTLAPALVAAATKVARRLGHRAGGLVGGLPVVAGPIILIYAVEQGAGFARDAAAAGTLGLVSSVLFCLAYAACAGAGYVAALAAGWLAFGVATALLSAVDPPLAVNVVVALLVIGGGSWLLARAAPGSVPASSTSDLLPWRLLITAVLVIALTAAAHGLSAHLAGLLAPLPIITAVLAGFTQARAGADAAIELLSGLVRALVCFLAFFAVLAATLSSLGGVAAFGLATVAALGLWALLVAATR
jgi:hypothetical protein